MSLSACSSGPNHLGNPLTLPIRGIANSIGEAAYQARRNKIKAFIAANRQQLHFDINRGGGPTLFEAMQIAGIASEKQAALVSELRSHPALYQGADIEPMVVTFMVYSD